MFSITLVRLYCISDRVPDKKRKKENCKPTFPQSKLGKMVKKEGSGGSGLLTLHYVSLATDVIEPSSMTTTDDLAIRRLFAQVLTGLRNLSIRRLESITRANMDAPPPTRLLLISAVQLSRSKKADQPLHHGEDASQVELAAVRPRQTTEIAHTPTSIRTMRKPWDMEEYQVSFKVEHDG